MLLLPNKSNCLKKGTIFDVYFIKMILPVWCTLQQNYSKYIYANIFICYKRNSKCYILCERWMHFPIIRDECYTRIAKSKWIKWVTFKPIGNRTFLRLNNYNNDQVDMKRWPRNIYNNLIAWIWFFSGV